MPDHRELIRPRSAALWLSVACFFVIAVVAAQTVSIGWTDAWPLALGGVAVMAWTWWLVWFPNVQLDSAGVTVVNPLRTITVPWNALVQVETKYALTLVTPQHRVSAWAAPAPGRQVLMAMNKEDLAGLPATIFDHQRSVALGDLPRSLSGSAALRVRTRWEDLVVSGKIDSGIAHRVNLTTVWNTVAIASVGGLSALVLALLFLLI